MTVILASLLPVLLYVLALKMFDSFALIKWSWQGVCFGVGIMSGLVLIGIVPYLGSIEIGEISLYPILEELLKGALMVWMVCSKKVKFLAETLIYGATCGGGFALIENIFYFVKNPDMTLFTALFRGFDCAFLHIGCTALIATVMLLILSHKAVYAIPFSFLPSIALHILHNELSLTPAIKMVMTLVIFIGLFMWLFNIGEKKIYGWMDHSISIDVQTLSSIKTGNFSDTKAGTYLLSVKDQFKPEVFFDMIMYVELYLDLKIEKQSLMLLSQAGFSVEDMGEAAIVHHDKMEELGALRKQIGKTILNVLKPIARDEI